MIAGETMIEAGNNKAFHLEGCVIALGTFDGVHIAHRVLLQKTTVLAKQAKVPSLVYTFANHPLELVAPERVPPLLTTREEKKQLMEKLGIDVLCAVPFDQELMNLPPEVFIGELVRRFHPKYVVCGYNYSFGANGAGSPELLMALGSALGFGCTVVPKIQLDGLDVSSTVIRQALSNGRDELAYKLLGRPYSFSVVKAASGFIMKNIKQQMPASGKHMARFTVENTSIPGILTVSNDGTLYVPKALSHQSEVRCDLLKKLNNEKQPRIG